MARRKPPASSSNTPETSDDAHCAQRGCVVPPEHVNDEFCPVCNNPLRIIEDAEPHEKDHP